MFWRRKRDPADFREEIETHLQLEADQNLNEGMSHDEAAMHAHRSFGNKTVAQELFYERSRFVWLDQFVQDLLYAVRTMRASPGFTLAAVVTLALGVGANTAIFSLIDAVLLRSLAVHDPGSLYFVRNGGAARIGGSPPYPCFEIFRKVSTSFSGLSAYSLDELRIRLDNQLEQVNGARTSGNIFEVLGLRPAAGRLLVHDDERLDPPAAVISYGFWQSRLAGSPNAIGRTFALNDKTFYDCRGDSAGVFWPVTRARGRRYGSYHDRGAGDAGRKELMVVSDCWQA